MSPKKRQILASRRKCEQAAIQAAFDCCVVRVTVQAEAFIRHLEWAVQLLRNVGVAHA